MPINTIFSDTKGFTQKLFDVIQTGPAVRLIQIFEKVLELYKNNCYSQKRLPDFETVFQVLKNPKFNSYNWSQAVLGFLSAGGGWESNSANTYLMLELIDATGYVRTEQESPSELLKKDRLKDLAQELKTLIDDFNSRDIDKQDQEAEAKKQREARNEVKPRPMPNVLVADTREQAQLWKQQYPEKSVFCLSYVETEDSSRQWELTWYDVLGNPEYLPISPKLFSLIKEFDDNKFPRQKSAQHNRVKACCLELAPSHSNVYVFHDGKQAAEFAQTHHDNFSFCLSLVAPTTQTSFFSSSTSKPSAAASGSTGIKWQLNWYDSCGLPHPVSLTNFGYDLVLQTEDPKIEAGKVYLQEKDGNIVYSVIAFDELIKMFVKKQGTLKGLSPPNPFNLIELNKMKLEILTATYQNKHTPKPVSLFALLSGMTQIPPIDSVSFHDIKIQCDSLGKNLLSQIEVIINPKPTKLATLRSTFVLTQKASIVQLQRYDSYGVVQSINLTDYPQLMEWLNKKLSSDTAWNVETLNQLKMYLRHITLRPEQLEEVQRQGMGSHLVKKFGVALIVKDSMALVEKMPKYRLINDTFFLVRELVDGADKWVLYQRKKRSKELPAVFEKIENDLQSLHDILDDGCRLIKMATDPTQISFDVLKGVDAVILFENEFYYANFRLKTVTKVDIAPDKQDAKARLVKCFNVSGKMANSEELKLIESVVGRIQTPRTKATDIDESLLTALRKCIQISLYCAPVVTETKKTGKLDMREFLEVSRHFEKKVKSAQEPGKLQLNGIHDLAQYCKSRSNQAGESHSSAADDTANTSTSTFP